MASNCPYRYEMAPTWKYIGGLFIGILLSALVACDGFQAPAEDPNARPEPNHPETVRHDLLGLVSDAKRGDTKAVQQRFQNYLMTQKDFESLFPKPTAQRLWAGYRDKLAQDIKKEAATAILKRVQSGYTDIAYERVGPTNHKETNKGDYALLKAMKTPAQMYSFRFIKPEGIKLGFRLNGFVYVNDAWRALFKSDVYLPSSQPQ